MLAHLIERGALDREDAPVGRILRLRLIEHVERPFVITGIGERAPISGENAAMFRVLQQCAFEHGEGLRALPLGAQRPRVVDCRLRIVRMGAVALGPSGRRTPIGVAGRSGKRSLRRLRRLAAGERSRQHGHEHDRRKPLDATPSPDRADHYGPVGPPRRVPAIKR